ncbi:MAG: LamG-like jellyroll fold domain-containing protein, partial [Cyanobacteria bacterium J06635_15]
MSAIKSLPPLEALETFRENHPDLGIEGILAVSEASFIERYTDFFEGDSRKARSAYREAQRIRALTTLLWANIKDTVGSPYLQETLFNNIPDTFLDHQGMIPAYPQLFGNLDFIECEHCRSIFGPAAYFVDLLRFIEKYIPQDNLPVGHSLEDRQPRLFRIPLDCENTFSLIPYIDLVNEVLEDVVRTADTPDAYEVVAETVFPMALPFHLPLAQIRLYLGQLKLTLQAIYRLFGEVDAAIAREILALSPIDYTQLGSEITDKDALDAFYDLDVLATGKGSLEDIAVFLEQTGLSRPELDQLLFLDLSTAEVEIGLSRLSFINATADQQGAIAVENTVQDVLFTQTGDLDASLAELNERQLPATLSADFSNQGIDLSSENTRVLIDRPSRQWRIWQGDSERIYGLTLKDGVLTAYSEAYDRLTNLTLPKLERIYRFLKLARQLNWSFADLDWALRSLADLDLAAQSLGPVDTAQTVLQFDGVNDFVQIPNATNLQLSNTDTPTLTLEAWVYLDGVSIHPILTKGDANGPFTQYQFWITPTGRLSFYSYLRDEVDPTTLFLDGQVPTVLTEDDLELIDRNHPVDDRGNQPAADGDGSFYTIDGQLVGLNLTSHGAIALNRFNHIAVTVNEVLTDVDVETAGDQTVYQLKFYLNGVLDSTWSLLAPIPLDQAPTDASATEIRLGTNYNSDFLAGSLSEVRLWNRIRTEAEIQRDRLSRLQGGETGLLAYWPLIDTPETELVDLAPGNAHPGYLGGSSHSSQPRWIRRDLVLTPLPVAIADTTLSFNGRDEYLAAEQVQGLDLSEFTLEAWVKLNAAGQRHGLITKGDATTGVIHFQWWIDADNRLKLSSANTDDVSSNVIAASTLTTDRVHLSVVVGADEIQFFVNGESKGSRDAVAFTPSGGDLYLGRSFDEATYLQGTMQEVRIWRGPRSQTQLVQNRDRQLTGAEAGLVGYWRLDSRDATDLTDDGLIRDLSFNRNHLHLGGLLAIYQPQLETHPEVILPDPVASPAQVLNFDPQHYAVTIINPQDYGLGHYEQFTLQLWFRVEDAKLGDRKQLLFTQGDAETGLSLYLSEDGRLRAHAWCHTLDDTQLQSLTLSTGVVRANRWHQATLVYDETADTEGVSYRLYLNGTAGEATPDGFRLDQVGPMHLGGLTADVITRFHDHDGLGNAHSFAGQITDFRLWQVAFAEDDVLKPDDAQHSRHIPPTESSDLLAYLPLTEGYGAPVGEHTGLRYAPTNDDPALLTPIIYDQTPETNGQVNHGNLSVGPDAVAPKWSISPRPPLHPDTALVFNGGYVRLPDTVDLGLIAQSFTIELWVKVAAFDATMAVLSASSSLSLTLEPTGDIQAQLGTAALTSSRALTTDQWHHLAWRFDQSSSNQSLFIDGQPVGESAGSLALGEATQLLLAPGFQGSISELRIWNQARSDTEILAHWNLRLVGNEAGLQGYWVFDTEPAQRWIDAVAGYPALLESLDESDLAPRVEIETPFNRQEIGVGLNDTDAIAELIDLPKTVLASTGTVELWVQFSRTRNQTLWDASTATIPFILALQNQALRFRVADGSGTSTIAEIDLADWPANFDTQIHHIAATWQFDGSATQIQLYLDDAIIRSTPKGNGEFPSLGRPVLGLGAA